MTDLIPAGAFGRRTPHIIPTQIECAYAAGFFDGEGNITIARNDRHASARGPIFNMRIGASQNDIAPLLWPNGVSRDEIDAATGYKRSSRDAYLQRLGARELIAASPGRAAAAPTLFD